MAAQSRREKLNALNKKRMDEQHSPKKNTTIVDEMLDNYTKASDSAKKAETTKEKSTKTKPSEAKKIQKHQEIVEKTVEEIVAKPIEEVSVVVPETESIPEIKAVEVNETNPIPEIKVPEIEKPVTDTLINKPEIEAAPTPDRDILKLLAEQYGLINVMDKSRVGRPKREGYYHKISLNLKAENLMYAKSVGGKYGGVTGYINYLIEQDMKKNK
ncbi:hypothetical protein [Butyrivibrio sp. WCE2006]|uniref:hypothetical protein n=1 Tax=Butyrivibrio sp. WCE2006 TaxID=1410611 RepID=UPI0005D19EFE|nr:hypothetical protein [Butyrivibrio sp. WCE2006]